MSGNDQKDPDTEAMRERLDELDEGIRQARHQAEEHGTIDDTTPEPTYADPDPEHEGDEPKPGEFG